MTIENIFEAIEGLRAKASTQAVYGQPVTVGERTIIPVADIKYGFGLGYGEAPKPTDEADETPTSSGSGGGGGGGVAARPVAVIVVTDEKVTVEPVIDEGRVALAGILTGAWTIFWAARTIRAIFKR